MNYVRLFEKGHIGKLELRNRVVMTAMGNGLATWNGEASPELIRFYEDRAKGGCGLIITEFTRVDTESGACNPNQLCIADRKHVRSVERMVQAVHRHGGKMFIQLHHGGREAPLALNGGKQPMAPSPVQNRVNGVMPREMTQEDIDSILAKFIHAAANAKRAGADGVELHAAHGYLLSEFISPYTNKRTDQYGGTVENRCRIVTDIMAGIRKSCGADFPLCVRMNGSDFIEGGIDLDDAVQVAKLLESAGADALDVSCAVYESVPKMIEPNYFEEGWRKNLAKTIKAKVSIPVIAVNTIKFPATAELLLEEGVSDFVGVSRGQMADPEWVNKTKAGREDLIRKCMGCMNCNKSVVQDRYLSCAANPVTGYATEYGEEKLIHNGDGRTVAVVGGGPAGMQAAIVLARRGFKPVIFEKNDYLGGLTYLATKPPHKKMVLEFLKTMGAELREYDVEVRLSTPATVEAIHALEPYGVIVANGGTQMVPDIPGIQSSKVYGMEDVLLERVSFSGKKVAVIGGGNVGLETAHFLCKANQVTVVEMLSAPGGTMYPTVRNMLLSLLKEAGVEIRTDRALASVEDRGITMTCMDDPAQKKVSLEADAVVLALGRRCNSTLATRMEQAFDRVARVGDCIEGASIAEAIRTGNDIAWYF